MARDGFRDARAFGGGWNCGWGAGWCWCWCWWLGGRDWIGMGAVAGGEGVERGVGELDALVCFRWGGGDLGG